MLTYFYAAATFQMAITIARRLAVPAGPARQLFTFCLNYSVIWFLKGSTPAYVVQHLAVYMPTVIMTLLVSYQLEVEAMTSHLQMQENDALKRELSRQNKDLARLSVTDPLTRLSTAAGPKWSWADCWPRASRKRNASCCWLPTSTISRPITTPMATAPATTA